MKGAPGLVHSKNKAPVTALREIAAGKVRFHRSSDEIVAEWIKEVEASREP
jgi:DNA-directed RNA polymerase subunit omega